MYRGLGGITQASRVGDPGSHALAYRDSGSGARGRGTKGEGCPRTYPCQGIRALETERVSGHPPPW